MRESAFCHRPKSVSSFLYHNNCTLWGAHCEYCAICSEGGRRPFEQCWKNIICYCRASLSAICCKMLQMFCTKFMRRVHLHFAVQSCWLWRHWEAPPIFPILIAVRPSGGHLYCHCHRLIFCVKYLRDHIVYFKEAIVCYIANCSIEKGCQGKRATCTLCKMDVFGARCLPFLVKLAI